MTVINSIIGPLGGSGGGGGGGGSGGVTTSFVYKPQTLVPSANVFNDWSLLYTALNKAGGIRVIGFDGTDDTNSNYADLLIPAGTWDMTGVSFDGIIAGGTPPVVFASDQCFLPNLFSVGGALTLGSNSTSSVVVVNTPGVFTPITVGFSSTISGSSAANFYEFQNGSGTFLILDTLGAIANSGFSTILLTGGSGAFISIGLFATLNADVVSDDGTGNLSIFESVGSGSYSLGQSGFTGAISLTLSDLSSNHGYSNTVSGLTGTNAQDAIDEAAVQTIPSIDSVTATTGGNHTIVDKKSYCLLNSSGTLTSYTVKMPAAPQNGQRVAIGTNHIITTFTLQANTSQSFVGTPPTALTLGQVFAYRWVSALSQWWPDT